MVELVLENITHVTGSKEIFSGLNFRISTGEHVGIIGRNGLGKSTLLDIIAGVTQADHGQLKKPGNFEIAYLAQDAKFNEKAQVIDIIFSSDSPMMRTLRAYEHSLYELEKDPNNSKSQKNLLKCQTEMDRQGAWDAEAEAKSILSRLGIQDIHQKISELSGGQKKRVALAQVLIQTPDLLILDEPTNHLDFAMIHWLEDYLKKFKGAVILVTHDRYFLDQIVSTIYEIDQKQLIQYPGNYESYLTQKTELESLRADQLHKNKQLFKKELAWMREGVRARGTKQKARKDRFKELSTSLKTQTSQASLQFDLPTPRLGKKVIEFDQASFSFSDVDNTKYILNDYSNIFQNRDRIGITGLNGSGKSTFLSLIAEHYPLDKGEIQIGETVRLGFYEQQFSRDHEGKRVLEYLHEIASSALTKQGEQVDIPQLLERFLFPRHMHGVHIRTLSGGEKRRLYLVQILLQLPNVLLLDEPTNDLDIDTLRVLEDFIDDFPGTVIAVSHDRYFLDRIADHLLIFKGDGVIEEYDGLLNDYLKIHSQESKENHVEIPKKRKPDETTSDSNSENIKTKLTYLEKKEWDQIESEIEAIEKQISDLTEEMETLNNNQQKMLHENGYVELMDMQAVKDDLEDQLMTKLERWEYLSQYAD